MILWAGVASIDITEDKRKVFRRGEPGKPKGEKHAQQFVVLTAQDGKLDDLVSIMNELAAETRKEPGFVRYDFFKEQGDPRVIVSYEEWRDAEAEAAHWQTDHLKGTLGKLGTVLGAQL